jgi:hypothetical protein
MAKYNDSLESSFNFLKQIYQPEESQVLNNFSYYFSRELIRAHFYIDAYLVALDDALNNLEIKLSSEDIAFVGMHAKQVSLMIQKTFKDVESLYCSSIKSNLL